MDVFTIAGQKVVVHGTVPVQLTRALKDANNFRRLRRLKVLSVFLSLLGMLAGVAIGIMTAVDQRASSGSLDWLLQWIIYPCAVTLCMVPGVIWSVMLSQRLSNAEELWSRINMAAISPTGHRTSFVSSDQPSYRSLAPSLRRKIESGSLSEEATSRVLAFFSDEKVVSLDIALTSIPQYERSKEMELELLQRAKQLHEAIMGQNLWYDAQAERTRRKLKEWLLKGVVRIVEQLDRLQAKWQS